MTTFLYYLGRLGQLMGMWILLVDVFTAGPMGPGTQNQAPPAYAQRP